MEMDKSLRVIDLAARLPLFLRQVREFGKLTGTEDEEFRLFYGSLDRLWDDGFIRTASERGVRRWESILGIRPGAGDTLEYRRQRILQEFSKIVQISLDFIKNRVSELYGDDFVLTMDPKLCRMTLLITTDQYESVVLLYDFLRDTIPANLELDTKVQSRRQFRQQLKISAGGAVGSNYMADIICGGSRRMPMKVSAGGFLRSYHTHIKSKLVE